jgi:Zn-dependent peptidase ImmA (M78 family)
MKNTQLSLFEQLSRVEPALSDEAIVRRLCEDLLDEADVKPPVNVKLLASLRGIARVEERLQPWDGVLAREKGQFVVGVRASDGIERQRFTVLHEAGHTLLPGFAQSRQYRCDGPRSRDEQLCDIAAAELLLPKRFFIPDLLEAGLGLAGVEELASLYEASIEATALRTVDLGPGPGMLLVFRVAHKPSEEGREEECEPKLRLSWAHGHGGWPYMPKHKSADDGSPFMRAYEGEVVDEVGTLGTLATADGRRVMISARRYGRNGRVLALVRPTPARARVR